MAFPIGHAGYVEVTPANPSNTLTDFPYVYNMGLLPASWWSVVKADGGDVQVYKEDGTRLPVYLHQFNKGTTSGNLHFGFTGTKATTAEKVRVYSGNQNLSQPAVGAAYGQHAVFPSTLRAYWPSGGGNDVTSYANNLTMTGSPTVGGVAGPLTGSLGTAYDGSTQFGSASASVPTAAPLTFLSSVYCTNNTLNNTVVGLYDIGNATANHFFLSLAGNAVGDPVRCWSTQANGFSQGSSATGYTINTWARASGVIASATSRRGGINGTLGTAETTSRVPTGIDGVRVACYNSSVNADFFAGNVSSLQIWTTALSDAWVAYDSLMFATGTQSSFYTTGSFIPLPVGSSRTFLYLGLGL